MAARSYPVVLAVTFASLSVAFPPGPPPPPHPFALHHSDGVEEHHDLRELHQHHHEQQYHHEQHEHHDHESHPVPARSYHFQYAVHDPITGDEKSHNEVSDGRGTVKGTYSLVEADGATRVVEYTADDVHGFQAEVKRIEPRHRIAAPAAPVMYHPHQHPQHREFEHRQPAEFDKSPQSAVLPTPIRVEDESEPHFQLPETFTEH